MALRCCAFCPFHGLLDAPVAKGQDKGQNPHVFYGHKVQPQDKLRPVVALVKPGEKAVIASAFHRKIAGFKIQRPGRDAPDDFHRQIARYRRFVSIL